MKSTISFPTFLAGATCALAMAACDSIKDVPEKPLINQPAPQVVLGGTISNLSSLRAMTLMNNGDVDNARSFIAGAPSVPNAGPAVVPFSFGSFPAGTPYNVTIKNPAFAKDCVIANGQGTLTAGVDPNITITCTNNTAASPRYDLTVQLPTNPDLFQGIVGAKVRLTNEEQIFEKSVTAAQTSVTFPGAILSAPGQINVAPWTVTATTTEGGVLNKCAVAGPTGSNPAGNITSPVVGTTVGAATPACKFPVSGIVGYSLPAGDAFPPAGGAAISGLELDLRRPDGSTIETKAVSCTPTSATVTTGTSSVSGTIPNFPIPAGGSGCAYSFDTLVTSGSSKGLYEVAVSKQPTSGQVCVVANGGSVNVFTLGTNSPVPVSSAHVLCRAVPAANKQLHGIFRLQSSTWISNAAAPVPVEVTSTYDPFNFAVSNTASSNMLALFNDGTFLYGSHGYATGPSVGGALISSGVQVEHGFYDYDPVGATLRFTLVTDTNNSVVFPSNFSPFLAGVAPTTAGLAAFRSVSDTRTTTPGLSATPNPQHRGNSLSTYMATPTMTGVTFGTAQVLQETQGTTSVFQTVRTISGQFGAGAGGAAWATTGDCSTVGPCMDPLTGLFTNSASASKCTTTVPCVIAANGNRLRWVLQEPLSIDGEMTGAWMQQDHRRIWVWDHRTIYGLGVGVIGGFPSMNDACFTMEDLRQSSGFYVRRGSGPGCHPFVQASTNPLQNYLHGAPESTDYPSVPGAQSSPPLLPGFIGRIPGGVGFPGNTSASPVQFHVAPASTFFSSADPKYFPTQPASSLDWCTAARSGDTAEILGLRYTSNNVPVDYPIYLCRTKLPLP